MKIGIISDTHDNLEMTEKACAIFKSRGIDFIIHCGDFTSSKIVKLFKDFNCRFVMGNADKDSDDLNMECGILGFEGLMESREFELSGKKFLVIHGNVVSLFRDAVASGRYDYIIKGHTHYFEDYVRNNVRVINPGSLFGSDESTIAILDVESGEVEKIILD